MNTELILHKVSEFSPQLELTDAYKRYLERPIVEGFTAKTTDTEIDVSSNGTTFVRRTIDKPIELSEFEEKAAQLRILAKKKNCKLRSLNKSMATIRENYAAYFKEMVKAMRTFKRLSCAWCGYVIHEGCSDDLFYNQTLQPLEFELQKMHYLNTLLMKYKRFMQRIDQAIENLSDDHCNYNLLDIYY